MINGIDRPIRDPIEQDRACILSLLIDGENIDLQTAHPCNSGIGQNIGTYMSAIGYKNSTLPVIVLTHTFGMLSITNLYPME